MTEMTFTPGNNNDGVGLQGPVLLTDVEVDDAVSEAEEEEHLFANQLLFSGLGYCLDKVLYHSPTVIMFCLCFVGEKESGGKKT